MRENFSIVIICKNEADIIGVVLQSAAGLTDDVLVYDTGSSDNTVELCKSFGVRVIEGEWLGYGKSKYTAVNLAKYDWVLSIDADEALDDELRQSLATTTFSADTVYRLRFKNFLGAKWLRWGEWGNDKHIRLFNRKFVNWNDADIHEELVIPKDFAVATLKGCILHYTMKDLEEYSHKVVKYALLNAGKYFAAGKRSRWWKLYLSPGFTFTKHFVFELGFLDGWRGLTSAYMTAYYTHLKYARLQELWDEKQKLQNH